MSALVMVSDSISDTAMSQRSSLELRGASGLRVLDVRPPAGQGMVEVMSRW